MKPFNINAQQKEKKKNEARKAKKEGREKAESKSQDCCVTFKPKNSKFLLSAHSWIRGRRSVRPVNDFF